MRGSLSVDLVSQIFAAVLNSCGMASFNRLLFQANSLKTSYRLLLFRVASKLP